VRDKSRVFYKYRGFIKLLDAGSLERVCLDALLNQLYQFFIKFMPLLLEVSEPKQLKIVPQDALVELVSAGCLVEGRPPKYEGEQEHSEVEHVHFPGRIPSLIRLEVVIGCTNFWSLVLRSSRHSLSFLIYGS
jgi:hypothetical protein